MSTSRVPALLDALVSLAPTVIPAGVLVLDGQGVTDDPGSFLMVGVDSDDDGLTTGAGSSQSVGPMATTRPRDEEGELNCVTYAWNGDGVQKSARDGVYAVLSGIEGLLRTNPSLGVQGVLWTTVSSTSLDQVQDEHGAAALLTFSIAFKARI